MSGGQESLVTQRPDSSTLRARVYPIPKLGAHSAVIDYLTLTSKLSIGSLANGWSREGLP
jgi:hypothetical protein